MAVDPKLTLQSLFAEQVLDPKLWVEAFNKYPDRDELLFDIRDIINGPDIYTEDIADVIHFVISRPYHVNIADLLIMPTSQL